jgi:hypothetical protein
MMIAKRQIYVFMEVSHKVIKGVMIGKILMIGFGSIVGEAILDNVTVFSNQVNSILPFLEYQIYRV